ncbi:MAG: Polysaccharide pyruvyl transferase [Betaproteobacteria bacterium ADurb.Bin341]|nr:MAG: Polysaccharide pyruvyl transferase [Betaproteobacteria bacterium ADurb.Bin341]
MDWEYGIFQDATSNMKKIGILTMHRVVNYGSALQAFALQEVLRAAGYENEIIDYEYSGRALSPGVEQRSGAVAKPSVSRRLLNKVVWWWEKIAKLRPEHRFARFWRRHLSLSRERLGKDSGMRETGSRYNLYILGSDQVLNPKYIGDDLNWLLSFVASSGEKIAYGSSFGCKRLPEEKRDVYRIHLAQFLAIGVRETSGERIVAEQLNLRATSTLDPTFLLNGNDWRRIFNLREKKRRYIFCYLLGYSFDPFPDANQLLKQIQEATGMEILTTGSSRSYDPALEHRYAGSLGPIEFLELMANADFVVTNSFHGTAFAINFARPFYTLAGPTDNPVDDRLLDLLVKLGHEDRLVIKGEVPPKIDLERFDPKHEVLETHRRGSLSFLFDNIECAFGGKS